MQLASRTLGVIGLAIAIGLRSGPPALSAQARDSVAPSRFDPIVRHVLTLKLETETLRGHLSNGWPPPRWNDSLAAMRTQFDLLTTAARRLPASHFLGLVERVGVSLETLARARDQRDARTALAHLRAGLDALQQEITEAESQEE